MAAVATWHSCVRGQSGSIVARLIAIAPFSCTIRCRLQVVFEVALPAMSECPRELSLRPPLVKALAVYPELTTFATTWGDHALGVLVRHANAAFLPLTTILLTAELHVRRLTGAVLENTSHMVDVDRGTIPVRQARYTK
jgi:hypothetical protein